ncbi:glycosyltransferase, partial [bacterium]
LLFVGRLEKEKNLYNLLDAVKNTPYGLDIAGQGRLKNNVESYITKNDINARLLGVIPNEKLPELYNRYPVYILPSLCEGMPKTLLEAMSSGRAVIASDIDEISSLVVNGESGLLCKTDKESISSAILTVMEDVDLRRKFGAAARKFILDNCSLSKIIEKEVLLYK